MPTFSDTKTPTLDVHLALQGLTTPNHSVCAEGRSKPSLLTVRYWGPVQVWDFEKVHERTVHKVNRALTNTIRCLRGGDGMTACSASADGTVKVTL